MSTDIRQLKITDPAWGRFVESHADATFFHHPAWVSLLSETYGFRSFILAVLDNPDEIIAGLPIVEVTSLCKKRRWISLPFTDYCFPLTKPDVALETLTDALVEQKRENRLSILEVRAALPARPGVHADARYMLHVLPLESDPEAVFAGFAKKFRQYPRRAEREGLHVSSRGSRQDVDVFYHLHLTTRVKLGSPVQPKRFFDLLWERVIKQGHGSVIIVENREGEPISGAVVLYHNTNAMIKYSASAPAFLDTRCHYFTFWKCIEWACQNGMTKIDFGRTDVPGEGLSKFKEGWGATEEPLAYSILAEAPPQPSSGGMRKVLSTIIQNSPPWVCRAIGQLLYKCAA